MVATEITIQGLVVSPALVVDETATTVFTKLDVMSILPAVHLVPSSAFEQTHSEVGQAL